MTLTATSTATIAASATAAIAGTLSGIAGNAALTSAAYQITLTRLTIIQSGGVKIGITQADPGVTLTLNQPGFGISITQPDTGAALTLDQPAVEIGISQIAGPALTLGQNAAPAISLALPGSIWGPHGPPGPEGPTGPVGPAINSGTVDAGALTLVRSDGATIAVAGTLSGPTGPAGPAGPLSPVYDVSFAGAGAGQSISLPAAPSQLSLLIIQGLVENPAEYTVSGSTLVIPPNLVWDGAECRFVFS